ncbi:MAG: hypothetical protein ABW217_09650, partial [Polyangiaceae bacterium]
ASGASLVTSVAAPLRLLSFATCLSLLPAMGLARFAPIAVILAPTDVSQAGSDGEVASSEWNSAIKLAPEA